MTANLKEGGYFCPTLERRGHRFVRYADDCMIFCKSRKSLYDITSDPYELNNLIRDPGYENVRKMMSEKLIYHMQLAGESVPVIIPAK